MKRFVSIGTIGILLDLLVACSPATAIALPATYPLAESGPYHVGMRTVKIMDESRGGHQVSVTVWYPAVGLTNETSRSKHRKSREQLLLEAGCDPETAPESFKVLADIAASQKGGAVTALK